MTAINKDDVIGRYFWLWPLFCLQAGLINSGGFLGTHRFVSHVTGFGTRVGAELIGGRILLGLEMCLIPIGFILGCFAAGLFNERPEAPRRLIPLGFLSVILSTVAILGVGQSFGSFGEPLELQRDFFLLFLLCFSCGLQNGAIVSLTMGLVRTTHMTGVATDLGLNLARLTYRREKVDSRWFKLRGLKLLSFGAGATLGVLIFSELEFLGFLIPAALNLLLLAVLVLSRRSSANLGQAVRR